MLPRDSIDVDHVAHRVPAMHSTDLDLIGAWRRPIAVILWINLFQDLRCLVEDSQLKIPTARTCLCQSVFKGLDILEGALRCYPGDQEKGAGRDSEHQERAEMVILRPPAQFAFFFHGLAAGDPLA